MRSHTVQHFVDRLEANAARAEAEYARIEASVMARRERGEDTSAVAPPSVVSSDFTLSKAEARAVRARRELDEYLARHGS